MSVSISSVVILRGRRPFPTRNSHYTCFRIPVKTQFHAKFAVSSAVTATCRITLFSFFDVPLISRRHLCNGSTIQDYILCPIGCQDEKRNSLKFVFRGLFSLICIGNRFPQASCTAEIMPINKNAPVRHAGAFCITCLLQLEDLQQADQKSGRRIGIPGQQQANQPGYDGDSDGSHQGADESIHLQARYILTGY